MVKVVQSMVEYFGKDVKRINHALKVLSFSGIISEETVSEKKTDEIIRYAAILHDIGIKEAEKKHNSTAGNYQELEGPPIARSILQKLNIQEACIDRVCFLVGNHHSYTKIDGIDFQIIVEADFLVNMYEDSMSRATIATIYKNIFKTDAGKRLCMSMYLS